jgi:hypothetical protein
MSIGKIVGAIIALLVAASVLYVLGSIAAAVIATRVSSRRGRRLGASTLPRLSGRWSGKLEDLRDGLVVELRSRRLATNQGIVGAAASNFLRPAVAIHVSGVEGATASYLGHPVPARQEPVWAGASFGSPIPPPRADAVARGHGPRAGRPT